MYESDIDHCMRQHVLTGALYGGCYSVDNFPVNQLSDGAVAYVVNTEPSHLNGKHWVVIYYEGERVVYFDSFGLPPVRSVLVRLPTDRFMLWNSRRLQGSRPFCGYYAMFFVLTLSSSQHSMSIFSDFFESNDAIVRDQCIKAFGI